MIVPLHPLVHLDTPSSSNLTQKRTSLVDPIEAAIAARLPQTAPTIARTAR